MTYTTSEAAEKSGLSVDQLRRLRGRDGEPLVSPSAMTLGGHARYSEADVRRLIIVAALIEDGNSIQRIKRNLVTLDRAAEMG